MIRFTTEELMLYADRIPKLSVNIYPERMKQTIQDVGAKAALQEFLWHYFSAYMGAHPTGAYNCPLEDLPPLIGKKGHDGTGIHLDAVIALWRLEIGK